MKTYSFSLLIAGVCALLPSARAGELNHYQPGIFGTRDFFVPPEPGFYYSQIDFTYLSDEFRNSSGNVSSGLTLGGSIDFSGTFNKALTLGLNKGNNSSLTLNFQGSNLDLAATLDRSTSLNVDLSLNAQADVLLHAESQVRAHIEDLDMRLTGVSPTFIWVSDEKIFGARFGALVAVPILDMSIEARVRGRADFNATVNGQLTATAAASLTGNKTITGSITATGPDGQPVKSGGGSTSLSSSTTKSKSITKGFKGNLKLHRDIDIKVKDSRTALSDIYVQPLWLGWGGDHYDLSLSDGFYAPTGHYVTGALDNTGMGYWTNQTQLAAAWYPWKHKGTAATVAATYEVHGNKQGVDIQPGNNFTVNWGISQFVPLNKSMTWLADIGIGGYDLWQVSDDRGRDVWYDASVHDEVHAVGVQLGLMQAKWHAAMTMRWMHEYAARDRFIGDMFVLNIAKKF